MGINVGEAHEQQLWHLIFAPFVDEQDKEKAREELRRRGRYGEAIVEQREED